MAMALLLAISDFKMPGLFLVVLPALAFDPRTKIFSDTG
jgi:hypothetical protein